MPLVVAAAHALIQLLLPLRPLLVHGFDQADALHAKTHTLLSWRMMAVATRNFISVKMRSEHIGANVQITRTYVAHPPPPTCSPTP